MERYTTINISGIKVLYDRKKGNYVKEGDIWNKELIKKVKELKGKNFVIGVLAERR